jgi:hypothetical protein
MNLLSKLDSFKNNQKIISYDQTTNDIINAILKQHNKSERDYDKLFYFFDCGNYYDTAKKVFNFLKKNIQYQIEPDELQTVKTPAAILATKNGDCKHMSLFIAGILDSYRRNTGEIFDLCYRFAAYDGSKTPEHVFVVINPGSNDEIWCDAVLDNFNEKKEPNFYKDKKIQNMALMAISGMHQQAQMNGVFDFLKPKGGGPGATGPGSSVNTPPKGSGLVNVITAGANAIPIFGSTISGLLTLIGPLIKGHSEDWFADKSISDKDYNKFMGIIFKWYKERGLDPSKNVHAGVWLKVGPPAISSWVPQPYQSLRRIEWLPSVWENTKNPDLAFIINDAIKFGILDEKYFINSKGEMKPEPSALTNLFGGGSDKPGGGGGYTIPLIIGGAALVAFFIFKKKK